MPGSVLDDLHRAGQVPDPYHGTQSLAAEWVPQRTWLYRTTVRLPGGRPLAGGERALLCFEGVDHEATVLVDGEEAGHHAGMFTPFEVDVSRRLADGKPHLLAVAVHPAPPGEPQVGVTARVREHKARMGYGWDFCPRMIHQGIWRPVTLEVAGPLRLRGATVTAETARTADPADSADTADTAETADTADPAGTGVTADSAVTADTARMPRTGATAGSADGRVRAEAVIEAASGATGVLRTAVRAPDGELVAEARQDVTAPGALVQELTVPAPEPWWPNGHGEQPLYEVETSLLDADGRTVGTHRVATGFRRVRLVGNPGAPDGALPYTLEVNGRRIHIKGWNWVPLDARYGVPRPERLAHLLELAADAHVTLLRVWGGGLIETREFYELCDRLGLLVWQEFSLSSSGIDSVPSDDPEYVALLAREAREVIPPRRHHPSLAVWGPGNELHETAAARPLTEADSPAVAVLADAVAEADPGRAWLPGSPSGRDFLFRKRPADGGAGQHDVHGPWEHQGLGAQQELYDSGTCLLHSEFGVEGMANARTWEAVVPHGRQWPVSRANPLMEHLGAWWNNAPLVAAAFGERPADVATMRRASRQLQYDGLRYAVEATLRRAPYTSGSIPWQFDEPFPNAWCTAAVDHRGDPKAAYHGVRRAYRPAHVCARFATQAWGGRETFTAGLWSWRQQPGPRGTVLARLLDLDGTVHAECVRPEGAPYRPGPATSVPAARAGEFTAPLAPLPGDLFVLHLELRDADGAVLAVNRYVHSRTGDLAPLLDLPAASVELTAEPALDAVRLRHAGGPAALGVYLTDGRPAEAEGWAVFGDNMLDLLPGESVRVPVRWRNAPPEGRAIETEGWNAVVHDAS